GGGHRDAVADDGGDGASDGAVDVEAFAQVGGGPGHRLGGGGLGRGDLASLSDRLAQIEIDDVRLDPGAADVDSENRHGPRIRDSLADRGRPRVPIRAGPDGGTVRP